jgi:DNA primase
MDAVTDIKARIRIEDLVARYCQLTKKGRNYVCLCPFHKDSHPSFLVSPDKGIGYCFACQNGGDIFNFYQKIENVDFPEALKALAEIAGVTLPDRPVASGPKKEEKERLRECLEAAEKFFCDQFTKSDLAKNYVESRKVPKEQIASFKIGYAPDSFSATYDHLLKVGFSRNDIVNSGLAVQRDLGDSRIYDRYRNRLIFPIRDAQGQLLGFGGRTLGQDDAKYINSSESPLYKKSQVLFGLDVARESIREKKQIILVEGYFDVLACHRVGVTNVVATCGTAITEEHATIIRRSADEAILCLDSDRAGQDATERAFFLLSKEGIPVTTISLATKDAADLVNEDPEGLKFLLSSRGTPYVEHVLNRLQEEPPTSPIDRRSALERVLMLLRALPFAVERDALLGKAAGVFQTSVSALEDDLRSLNAKGPSRSVPALKDQPAEKVLPAHQFSSAEVVLGMVLCHPELLPLLQSLIEPEDKFPKALYLALRALPQDQKFSLADITLEQEDSERAAILALWSEQHGFSDWSESMAAREIKRNCISSNREFLRKKLQQITERLQNARRAKDAQEEALLTNQYEEILKLSRMAGV